MTDTWELTGAPVKATAKELLLQAAHNPKSLPDYGWVYDVLEDDDTPMASVMRKWKLAPSCVVGHSESARVELYYVGEGDVNVADPPKFDVDAHTVPSTFGDLKAEATVLDESVRKAREATAVRADWSPGAMAMLTRTVNAELFPDMAVELRLKKVNVYGPGGKFAPHVDTPREGVLGTVVVVLPADGVKGGALRIQGVDENVTCGVPTKGVAFAAFYSSMLHEVEEVVEGTRVSVAYDIVKDAARVAPGPPSVGENDFVVDVVDTGPEPRFPRAPTCPVKAVVSFLQEKDRATIEKFAYDSDELETEMSAWIGMTLNHRYSYAELAEANFLKGNDREVRRVLLALGCTDLRVDPVIITAEGARENSEYDYKPDEEPEVGIRAASKEDLRRMVFHEPPATYPCVHVFARPQDLVKSLKVDESSGGYTGNEFEPGFFNNVYFTCVLRGWFHYKSSSGSESGSGSETESESKPASESDSKPESESKPASESESKPESKPESGSKPAPESESNKTHAADKMPEESAAKRQRTGDGPV